jgi:hypothetical protein
MAATGPFSLGNDTITSAAHGAQKRYERMGWTLGSGMVAMSMTPTRAAHAAHVRALREDGLGARLRGGCHEHDPDTGDGAQ